MKISILTVVLTAGLSAVTFGQSTGLSGWSIFLDPGHSRTENMGLYNYSEAQKVLRVALHLQELLTSQTDIDTVYMSRTTDTVLVSLSQRTTFANTVNADFYYSIHSDAGSPSANSTLMLWGGWRSNGESVEKTPQGGKKMGDIMIEDLTASMRIATRGGYYDRTFYQGFPDNHANKWPYLHVNRESNMASVLSEAGFHTNPVQQQRNMNAEWKKLEAQSAFWSILEYHAIERPPVGIATGFVRNLENQAPVNGATITIGDFSYTTDTFESLFNQYSSDPNQLANGFYYIENLQPGADYQAYITAPGYYSETVSVSVNPDFFTFSDVNLISSKPPTVDRVSIQPGGGLHDPKKPIVIHFSRPMNTSSVVAALEISPLTAYTLQWINNRTLRIIADDMDYDAQYLITLQPQASDAYGHAFDGNYDGLPGSPYFFQFRTIFRDVVPPLVSTTYPEASVKGVELKPILSVTFNEPIDQTSVLSDAVQLSKRWQEEPVSGQTQLFTVGDLSVLQFFPDEPLSPNTYYDVIVSDQITDLSGNTLEYAHYWDFMTGNYEFTTLTIDNFNSAITSWWVPQQSGSTTGILTELTDRAHETSIVNPNSGSTGSMKLNYGWDLAAGSWLIREYLPPTASQNRRFDKNNLLEATIFGDGSGNRFRFMVRDGNSNLQGSPWYTIDWIGWKRVQWDMRSGVAVPWVGGTGVLTGTLYTDSFQLTYSQGAPTVGVVYIDDYQLVNMIVETSAETHADAPQTLELLQNYPNPFNPSTVIRFRLPETAPVRLHVYDILGQVVSVLKDEVMQAGTHQVTFNATSLTSGVYIYRLQALGQVKTSKMLLVK